MGEPVENSESTPGSGARGDPRLRSYRDLVLRMADGRDEVAVPADGSDPVGELGAALRLLGASLDRRMAEFRAVLEIAAKINSGVSVEQVLNHVYDSFQVLIPYGRLGCALIHGNGVKAVWARSRAPRIELPKGYTAPLLGSSLAAIVETGRPRVLNDLEQYLREHPGSDGTRRILAEGFRSSLTCPLTADGRPIGFLFFSSEAAGTYTEDHVTVYQLIAGQVSLAVAKSRAFEELLGTQRRLALANSELTRAAYSDALTGVPSRRHFDMVLLREWKRAVRYGEPLSLVIVDVDHFKQFNDTYGHPAGDECLRRVAGALQESAARGSDVVARIGGEEFAALLPRTSLGDAILVAERMRAGVESLGIRHERSPAASHVTVSLGAAGGVPRPERVATSLLHAADAALYRAKAGGRNRVVAAEG